MAHFAEIDKNNKVIRVIVADDKEWCENNLGGNWVQTSYNTFGGVNHREGGIALHKNFAGKDYNWDGIGFYAPKPFNSWKLNKETYLWEAPIQYPNDGKKYAWNESELKWDETDPL